MDSFGSLLQNWRVDTTVDSNGYRHHKSQSGPECWKEVGNIGGGNYGGVCQELCLSGCSKNSMRAVKHVLKGQIPDTRRELVALVTFSNSNIPEYRKYFVQFLGWFDDAKCLYIIMDFFEHGDLHKYMRKNGTIPETEAASITAQVAQALQYMHDEDYIHRDIKPPNILISRPGPYWHVKVADFGISKNTDGTMARTNAGTDGFMAPEVRSSNSYTKAVDVWSLGAVAYYMRIGFPPFTNRPNLYNYPRDYDWNFPFRMLSNSGEFCKEFVMRAMAEVPKQRLTIEQALAHDWLQIDYTQLGVSQRGEPTTSAKYEQTASTLPASNSWSSLRQSQISPHLGQHSYGQENKSKNKVGSLQRKEVGNNPGRIVAQSNPNPMGTTGRHSEARTRKVDPKQSHFSQTLHKSADVISKAQQFVGLYYQAFDTDRNGLWSFYRDDSMLTFEISSVQGAKGIVEKLSSLPFQKVKHQVATFDAQPSQDNAITVLLTGALLVNEEQEPMSYTELFKLVPENGSYYVLNDVFRLLYAAN